MLLHYAPRSGFLNATHSMCVTVFWDLRIIKKKISIFATIKELTLQQNIRHILKSYLPIALVATLTVVGCVKKALMISFLLILKKNQQNLKTVRMSMQRIIICAPARGSSKWPPSGRKIPYRKGCGCQCTR